MVPLTTASNRVLTNNLKWKLKTGTGKRKLETVPKMGTGNGNLNGT